MAWIPLPFLMVGLLLCSCQSPSMEGVDSEAGNWEPDQLTAAAPRLEAAADDGDFVLPGTMDWADLATLLSMTFDEASAISTTSMEVGPGYRVAADEIEVLARSRSGVPSKVVAKGRVFVELRTDEVMIALAEQAEIGVRELILRGRPLLGRGDSVLAGVSEGSVFTVTGDALRVVGDHELLRRDQIVERRERLLAEVSSALVAPAGGGGAGRSYRIDQDFELPPLPSADEQPDPVLLGPPPELPDFDEDLDLPLPEIP